MMDRDTRSGLLAGGIIITDYVKAIDKRPQQGAAVWLPRIVIL
jgi:hypothetical protein